MAQTHDSEAAVPAPGSSRLYIWVKRLVNVEPEELKALAWSFTYFFALLCSYYILRPLRDEMGIAGGVKNLQWLFTGTFLAMLVVVPLFGWIASRYPRKRFLPYVYYFFIANIVLFFVLFQSNITHAYVARAFYIWVSVFNLFVVSVFWSFMADIFLNAQAKRLFGFIAAGGTAGALTGPALTATLAVPLGPTNLLLISAGLLGWAVFCVKQLIAWRESLFLKQPAKAPAAKDDDTDNAEDQAMGGGILAAFHLVFKSPYLIGICLLMLLTYNIDIRIAEQRLLPLAADRGMATLINRPFQRGSLFSKVKGKPLPAWAAEIDCKSWGQYFLKFIASHPAVTCSIPATSKVHHMVDNMAAGFGRLPDAEMRNRMARHFESL